MWEILRQVGMCGERVPYKPYEQDCQSKIIDRKLSFSAITFEITIKAFALVLLSVGFGDCGEMRQHAGRYRELMKENKRLICYSIVSNAKLDALPNNAEAITRRICSRLTNYG